MENSKLWRVFSLLTPTEIKQLAWFLDSPYHNRRTDTVALFQVLKECRKENELWEKEIIWRAVFPEKPWSGADFRHLCRYLLGLIEEFLAVNAFRKSDLMRIQVAETYADRGLSDLSTRVVDQTRKRLAAADGLGSRDLLYVFMLEQMRYQAHAREKRSFQPGLQSISDALDRWFVVQKMQLACTMGSQQKVFQAEYSLGLLSPVLELAAQNPWQEEPLIGLYAHTYAMLHSAEAEAAYQQQVEALRQHAQLLQPVEQRTLSLMAINFCIRQLNQGHSDYLAEVYQLYKRGLDEQWLFERGELSPWTYKNIVAAGLKLRDYAWVGQFIEAYRSHLPEDLRFTFHQYARAELQLAQQQFQDVLRTLRFLQIKDPLTQLRARILQIKAGFELGEFRLIESQLENLRQLLRRKKELAYHREAYRNFERKLRRLMAMGPDADRNAFLADLATTEIVAEKEWLEQRGRPAQ